MTTVLREPTFRLSLRFGEGSVDVDELELELGLRATTFWKIGDVRRTPKGTVRPGGPAKVNFSTFDLPSSAEKLSEALVEVVSTLEKHQPLLARVKDSGGTVQLFVGWFIESNVVDYFDAPLLGRISSLGIDLFMDVYAGGPHSKPTPRPEHEAGAGAPRGPQGP